MSEREIDPRDPAPFLEPTPALWAARSLATVLIALSLTALVGSSLFRVPDTVTVPFELVPRRGTDPVRAPRAGTVRRVKVMQGQTVDEGDVLFVLGSDLQSDRASGLRTAETHRDGARDALAHREIELASRARADDADIQRLERQRADLDARIALERDALRITLDVVARYKELRDRDLVSRTLFARYELEATNRRIALQTLEGERTALGAALEARRNEAEAQRTADAEALRRLAEEVRAAEIDIEGLRRGSAPSTNRDLDVKAPCRGTVLALAVQAAGSFVQDGDTLADLGCDGAELRARLAVPQASVGRLEPGLGVKLLYDAFPYERYGVRFGTLDWVSPSSVERNGAPVFPALAKVTDTAIWVDGHERRMRAGMAGRAVVVVGRRSLLSIAFEPLRRLREATRDAPGVTRDGGAGIEGGE